MAILGNSNLNINYRTLEHRPYREKLKLEELDAHRKSNFLCRISDGQWKELMRNVELAEHRASEEEFQALKLGHWKHPIFKKERWIVSAFALYLENRIDQDTMCKLFLYNACKRHIVLENNPEISKLEKWQLFKEGGLYGKIAQKKLWAAVSSYLSKEQFILLTMDLSSLEPSRTQFFCLRRTYDPALRAIAPEKGNPIANFCLSPCPEDKNVAWQFIASPDFIYRIFKARFFDQAMRPSCCLGYRGIEKLSDLENRVMGVPSFIPFPKRLHGCETSPLTFYHHDIYHLAIESANPHRALWIEIAGFADREDLGWMKPLLLDREFRNYVGIRQETLARDFWLSIFRCICVLEEHNRNILQNKFRAGDPAHLFVQMFTKFFHLEKDRLASEWGVTLEELKALLGSIQESPESKPTAEKFLQDLYLQLTAK